MKTAIFEFYDSATQVWNKFSDDKIILELKTVEKISDIHRAQLFNYLKATNKKLGIIINFKNQKLEYERIVL